MANPSSRQPQYWSLSQTSLRLSCKSNDAAFCYTLTTLPNLEKATWQAKRQPETRHQPHCMVGPLAVALAKLRPAQSRTIVQFRYNTNMTRVCRCTANLQAFCCSSSMQERECLLCLVYGSAQQTISCRLCCDGCEQQNFQVAVYTIVIDIQGKPTHQARIPPQAFLA